MVVFLLNGFGLMAGMAAICFAG